MEMVVIDTVGSRFEANLLAAKLGANGLLWQLRTNYPGAYTGERPFGGIELLVPADEEAEALLVLAPDAEVMADVVFEGQDPADFESSSAVWTPTVWVTGVRIAAVVVVGLLLVQALAVVIHAATR